MANRKISDVAEIVMGQSPPGSTVSANGDSPLLNGPTEFGPSHPTPTQFTTDGRKFANPGDILFCVRGSTTGRMNWADQKYAIGRGIAAIRHQSDPALQPLVRGILELALQDLLVQATGSTFPNVSARQLADVTWPDIDRMDQRAIANIFNKLDSKIELNRQMNETLEDMANVLFKSWFVDFDPVRVKSEGRQLALPVHLVGLFPDRFVDSELGLIPEDWRVGTLGEVAREARSSILPHAITLSTPYIALKHMPKRSIALSEWATADHVESSKLVFKQGDLLFGKLRPYFHKAGIAPIDGVCSTDIVVMSPEHPDSYGYVLSHVSSASFVDYSDASSTGTRMPRTSWKVMSKYRIAIPPIHIVKSFNDLVRPMLDRIVANIHESRRLSRLRDTLLPRLISGETRMGSR